MFRRIKRDHVLDTLSRHTGISDDYISLIKKIPKTILENIGSDLAKEAVAKSQDVVTDLHSHKAFLRLSVSSSGILYAEIFKMRHRNEEPLLEFFHERFPTFTILIESKRGVFFVDEEGIIKTSNLPLEQMLQMLESQRPKNSQLEQLTEKVSHEWEELWTSFAESQLIQGMKHSSQMKSLSRKWKWTVPSDTTLMKPLDEFFEEE